MSEYAAGIEDQISRLSEVVTAPDETDSGIARILGNTWTLERLESHLPDLLATHPSLKTRFSDFLPPAPIHAEVGMTATEGRILLAAVKAGVGYGVLPRCLRDQNKSLLRSGVRVGPIEGVLSCQVNPDTASTERGRPVRDLIGDANPVALGGILTKKKRAFA